ncbi:MAG: hypothetical protein HZA88_16585 [Verrucomicrobia bacterium]|nr:hypothetical protein [Verrucomicrobiota bacterium]
MYKGWPRIKLRILGPALTAVAALVACQDDAVNFPLDDRADYSLTEFFQSMAGDVWDEGAFSLHDIAIWSGGKRNDVDIWVEIHPYALGKSRVPFTRFRDPNGRWYAYVFGGCRCPDGEETGDTWPHWGYALHVWAFDVGETAEEKRTAAYQYFCEAIRRAEDIVCEP